MNLPLSNPVLLRMWKIINYRQIGFINLLYFKSCALFLIVIGLAYCCLIFILSSYVVMKYYEALGIQGAGSFLIVAVMALGIIVVGMQFSITTTLNSCKLLASLKNDLSIQSPNASSGIMTRRDMRFVRGTMRSLQPIIVNIGIFFTIQRSTLLTCMNFNLSSLIDVILTFGI